MTGPDRPTDAPTEREIFLFQEAWSNFRDGMWTAEGATEWLKREWRRAAALAGTPTDAEKKELEWRRYHMEHNWPRNQFGSLLTQGEWAALAGTAPAELSVGFIDGAPSRMPQLTREQALGFARRYAANFTPEMERSLNNMYDAAEAVGAPPSSSTFANTEQPLQYRDLDPATLADELAAKIPSMERTFAALEGAGKVSQADLRYEVGAAPAPDFDAAFRAATEAVTTLRAIGGHWEPDQLAYAAVKAALGALGIASTDNSAFLKRYGGGAPAAPAPERGTDEG